MNNRKEFYKSIEGFSRYLISSEGKVIDGKWNTERPQYDSPDGYKLVSLKDDFGSWRTLKVHRLVAIAFIPNPEGKKTVDHINMDKKLNRKSNLRWATQKEQMNFPDQNIRKYWTEEDIKEAKREDQKRFFQKHPDYKKIWRENNKDKISSYNRSYKMRKQDQKLKP